ncbi:hypothetical protein L1987_34443 [Smallanthus sonchifolius]|uniref:Uncharacterized protein n=1 Tax=Smallanthus sonchifolius TaxID=185202 RepID=A0ACB9HUP3_9ASTR|nr:hypothetical protein L1987_34443 [Smallanthus sonchifolius]
MASASASTQNSVGGSTSDVTVVSILPCSRNQEIWAYFDLCEMSNGSQKARCKRCGRILGATGNSTLRKHIASHAKHTQDDLNMFEEDPNFESKAIRDFNSAFNNMFDYYLRKYGGSGNPSNIRESMGSGSSSSSSRNPMLNLFNTLRNENTKRARGTTPSSELGRYQATDFISTLRSEEFENFDILSWWQGRESQYPVLAAMARDLLTVQASTVASESDHLDAAERVQHVAKLEGELDIEQEIHEFEVEQGATNPLSDEEQAYDEAQRISSEEE